MLSVPLGLWQTLTCKVRVAGLVGGEGAGPEQSWVGPRGSSLASPRFSLTDDGRGRWKRRARWEYEDCQKAGRGLWIHGREQKGPLEDAGMGLAREGWGDCLGHGETEDLGNWSREHQLRAALPLSG